MKDAAIRKAEYEAKRFLEAVQCLRAAEGREPKWSHPKESGALRRVSMDLTRALAEMRRP